MISDEKLSISTLRDVLARSSIICHGKLILIRPASKVFEWFFLGSEFISIPSSIYFTVKKTYDIPPTHCGLTLIEVLSYILHCHHNPAWFELVSPVIDLFTDLLW